MERNGTAISKKYLLVFLQLSVKKPNFATIIVFVQPAYQHASLKKDY
jgi:hypothetical protein